MLLARCCEGFVSPYPVPDELIPSFDFFTDERGILAEPERRDNENNREGITTFPIPKMRPLPPDDQHANLAVAREALGGDPQDIIEGLNSILVA